MIDLVGRRKFYYIISFLVMVPGLISLAVFQLRPGIEFTSGSTFTLKFADPSRVSQDSLSSKLDAMGYSDARVQTVTGESAVVITVAVEMNSGSAFISDAKMVISTPTGVANAGN